MTQTKNGEFRKYLEIPPTKPVKERMRLSINLSMKNFRIAEVKDKEDERWDRTGGVSFLFSIPLKDSFFKVIVKRTGLVVSRLKNPEKEGTQNEHYIIL